MNQENWIKFFAGAGIPAKEGRTYASLFVQNRIRESHLTKLSVDLLNRMGIDAMGDVLDILDAAKNGLSLFIPPINLISDNEQEESEWDQSDDTHSSPQKSLDASDGECREFPYCDLQNCRLQHPNRPKEKYVSMGQGVKAEKLLVDLSETTTAIVSNSAINTSIADKGAIMNIELKKHENWTMDQKPEKEKTPLTTNTGPDGGPKGTRGAPSQNCARNQKARCREFPNCDAGSCHYQHPICPAEWFCGRCWDGNTKGLGKPNRVFTQPSQYGCVFSHALPVQVSETGLRRKHCPHRKTSLCHEGTKQNPKCSGVSCVGAHPLCTCKGSECKKDHPGVVYFCRQCNERAEHWTGKSQ